MPRRVIRKLDIAGQPTFDEQLWPINALLVVLCALVAGAIVGTSQFTHELAWSNGWVRLATLIGSTAFLMLMAWWFQGRIGRRFQLGAAASLVVHVLIGILLYWRQLQLHTNELPVARRESVPVLVQYEYQFRSPDDQIPREAHERPVETETLENRPIELSRITPEEPQIDEPQPQPVPETQRSVEPTQMQMKRNELAAPKRADQESRHSRSLTTNPAQPSERISAPEQRASADSAQVPQAQETEVSRSQIAANAERPTIQAPPATQTRRDSAQLVRRTQESQAPSPAPSAETVARAMATPDTTAQTAEPLAANASQPQADTTPQVSNQVEIARSQNTAPATRGDSIGEPAIAQSAPAATSPELSTQAAGAPNASIPAAAIAPRTIARANAAAASPDQIEAQSNAVTGESQNLAAPAELDVARTAPSQSNQFTSSQTNAPTGSDTSVATVATARRDLAGAPNIDQAAPAANSPSRSVAVAATAVSPANVNTPVATSRAVLEPSAERQPAATGLSRTTAGSAGVGESPNFDRGLPAASSAATVASAASQRAASTIDAGTAPAASAPATLPRARAEASIDSTTVLADNAATGDYRGGPVASSVEASSSAAVERQASAAPRGRIAADMGNLPADTGAPQVVSPRGVARNASGGQPTVAAAIGSGRPGRTTAPGEALAPISASVAAPVARAPEGTGSQASSTTSLASQDRPVARSSSIAPAAPASAGENSPAGSGQAVAATAINRSIRADGDSPGVAERTGTGPGRRTASSSIADSIAADVPLNNAVAATGSAASTPTTLQASGNASAPSTNGPRVSLPGADPSGAAISNIAASAAPSAIGSRRASAEENAGGPEVQKAISGAPSRSAVAAMAGGGGAIDAPPLAGDQRAAVANAGDSQPGPATGPNAIARQSTGGVPVEIASIAGPGGLAAELSAVVGSRKTAAQRDSQIIHDTEARFLGREISGAVPEPSFIREAAKAFERRGRDNGTGQGQQGTKTEEAVERGLEFLARAQQADGHWSFQAFPGATEEDAGMIQSDTAATGLALMAFLGGGYDHFQDKHRDTVRRGLEFLLHQQSDEGDLYVAQDPKSHESAWLYSHAIASIALCEALGMTGDQDLRAPAQRALDFIQSAQDRQYGGWRYEPGAGSDTSVAGWQLMALKSGELAGLKINRETYDGVRKWLDRAQANNDGSQYLYNPTRPNTQYPTDQRRPTMTSVGLLMRLYLGWNRSRPEMKRGAEHILKYPAAYGTASNPMRDTYYWYYATQLMFHMRGDYWREWNGKLYPLLINSQVNQGAAAGSWNPGGTIPDRWGPQGGRIYVTTMNLLSLEVYYRHLPIYEETAR